jgi:hypothetical protein
MEYDNNHFIDMTMVSIALPSGYHRTPSLLLALVRDDSFTMGGSQVQHREEIPFGRRKQLTCVIIQSVLFFFI